MSDTLGATLAHNVAGVWLDGDTGQVVGDDGMPFVTCDASNVPHPVSLTCEAPLSGGFEAGAL